VKAPVRLGAVSYLNVRPLVHGLDAHPGRVSLRFDVPAECARLLAADEIDLGMVPSITYAGRPGDRIVPGVCIGSDGPVASVALFSRKPLEDITQIALDTSSRTSAALVRILCARRFGISPTFVSRPPDLPSMLSSCDAALVIGDAALFADHRALAAEKIDLGAEWTAMTGLPFVWAFWSGRPAALDAGVVALLGEAARDGRGHLDQIANDYCAAMPHRAATARHYLRENLVFALGDRELQGLRTYYREAARLDLVTAPPSVVFFDRS
jgi:chorismate dehydratase